MGRVGLSAYLSLIGRRRRRRLAFIRGWALINFFCYQDGRLFEVGANSRLVAYSNNGMVFSIWVDLPFYFHTALNYLYVHLDVWASVSLFKGVNIAPRNKQ